MVLKKLRERKSWSVPKLPKPKITFDRLGQLIFTFREVTKLAAKVNLKLLILIFVLNSFWGISAVPGFYLEKLVIDRLIEAVGNPNWRPLVVGIGILIALRLALELVRNVLSNVIGFLRHALSRYFDAELDVMMGKKLGELDLATIENSDFQNKFNKIQRESGRRVWGLMIPLSDIPNYLFGFISAVVILLLLHPLISVGVFIFSLPQFIIDQRFIRKDYQLHTKVSPLYRVWGWINYILVKSKNFMELKLLNLSDFLGMKLKKIQKEVLDQMYDLRKKRELSRFITYFPLVIFELVVSIWLISLVIVREITVGSFELYIRSLRSAQQNLTGLVSSFLEIYENYIFVTDLIWFLNLDPQISLDSGEKRFLKKENYSIEFKDVWFRYKEYQPWAIKDMSFKIKPGERVAIVGENGAGKSTLIKVLARFYDPFKGKVFIGGDNLKKIKLMDWRENLAILFQGFERYPFSAKETIGYGDVKRLNKLDEIKDAAARTGMDKYIESLPLKYNNPLDPEFEKGVKPSIGQWQRLGISRMFFRKDAQILIMDEPTSSVDPEAEEKIFKELIKKAKGRILMFVTQRFSTVRLADRI
jgi:ABC-type multidrug transport system fused ATPase/permease subunit